MTDHPAGDQAAAMPAPSTASSVDAVRQAQILDDAVNRIDLIRTDVNTVIHGMPDDSPMFVIVDIVNALWNLRNASVLLDKASDALEADAAQVVTR